MDNIISGAPETQYFSQPFTLYTSTGKKGDRGNTHYPEPVRVDGTVKLGDAVRCDHTHIDFGGEGRAEKNFKGVDAIVLDVDNSHSDDPKMWAYGHFPNPTTQISLDVAFKGIEFGLTTSRNHMKPKDGKGPRPKYHLYFPIPKINSPTEYKRFMAKVFSYYNGEVFKDKVLDEACKDAARPWFATSLSTPPIIYNEDGQENLFDFIARVNIPASRKSPGRPANPAKSGGEVGEPIKNGERDNTLFRFAIKVLRKNAPDMGTAKAEFEARLKDQQEPLPQGQVDKVWESAVKIVHDTPFYNDAGKVDLHRLCEWFKGEHHVKKIDGRVHVYNSETGTYEDGGDKDSGKINELIYEKVDGLTSKFWQIHHILVNTTPETPHTADKGLICLKNGVLNIGNWKKSDFSPEFVIKNPIPANYNPKAAAPIVDKFLNDVTLNDADMKAVILEGLGASMYRGVLGKAYWLFGGGRNGKSIFLEVLDAILGFLNVSHVPIEYLSEKFKNASLEGKTANIVHEAGGAHIKDTTYIKAIIRGEPIDIEQKNHPTRTITPYCTLWTASNEMPVIGYLPSQDAISDRFLIIPFDAHFEAGTDADDPDILEKLTTPEALEYWVLLGLLGLKRLLDNKGRHTTCARIEAAGRDRRHGADTISAWIDDKELDADYFIGESTSLRYAEYKEYCEKEGRGAKTQKEVVVYICKKYGFVTTQSTINMARVMAFKKR